MIQQARKSSLSKPRRELVELMQIVNFGQIENLIISNGEPVMEPAPRAVFDVKLNSKDETSLGMKLEDYVLKAEVIELFARFDGVEGYVVDRIEVKHGLPFRMKFTSPGFENVSRSY